MGETTAAAQAIADFHRGLEPFWHPVLEASRAPLSAPPLLYVRPADLPLIAFQRRLEELAIPQI